MTGIQRSHDTKWLASYGRDSNHSLEKERYIVVHYLILCVSYNKIVFIFRKYKAFFHASQ